MYYIYRILCTANDRSYVGRTQNFEARKKRHLRELRKGNHHNVSLQRDFKKYGESAFRFSVKTAPTLKESMRREQVYIDSGKHVYNINPSATCGDLLSRHPNRKEILKRRGESVRKHMATLTEEDRIEKYGRSGEQNGMYGRTHTDKAKRAIGKANKGNSYAKGSVRSTEVKAALSKHASERVGELNAFYGKQHTAETKAKLAAANKGKLPVNTLKVRVGKKTYESASAAARALGCSVATIGNRVRNSNFPDYEYVS